MSATILSLPAPPPANDDLAAMFYASPEIIAELLQLPPGAYIDAVDCPADSPGLLRFRVRGAGWPVVPGDLIRGAIPTLHRLRDEVVTDRVVVNWHLPQP